MIWTHGIDLNRINITEEIGKQNNVDTLNDDTEELEEEIENKDFLDESKELDIENVQNIEQEEKQEEQNTALVVVKPNSILVAQKMFKKSIKISITSFLISLSLGFLNFFI